MLPLAPGAGTMRNPPQQQPMLLVLRSDPVGEPEARELPPGGWAGGGVGVGWGRLVPGKRCPRGAAVGKHSPGGTDLGVFSCT